MSIREAIELRLSSQHEVGMTIMLDTPDDVLLRRPGPDKWNISEQFAHLVRYQHLFFQRVDEILMTKNPSLDRYSAETDPEFPRWLKIGKENLIQILVKDRFGVYTQFLEFSEKELNRLGTHPVYGQLTLMDWHQFFVLHEAHHLHAMWKLSKNIG